jgi:hypothetical protein
MTASRCQQQHQQQGGRSSLHILDTQMRLPMLEKTTQTLAPAIVLA